MKTLEETKTDCLITIDDLEKDSKILQSAVEKAKKAVAAAKTMNDLREVGGIVRDEIKRTHYLDLKKVQRDRA